MSYLWVGRLKPYLFLRDRLKPFLFLRGSPHFVIADAEVEQIAGASLEMASIVLIDFNVAREHGNGDESAMVIDGICAG